MKKTLRFSLFVFLLFFTAMAYAQSTEAWKAISLSPKDGRSTYKSAIYGNPFSGSTRSILAICPELSKLTGIRLPVDAEGKMKAEKIQFSLPQNANLLIAITPKVGSAESNAQQLAKVNLGKGVVNADAVLTNAISITEMPALDVYAVSYKKGNHTIDIPANLDFQIVLLGAMPTTQVLAFRDVALSDEVDYPAFHIEEFAEGKPLFTVVGGMDEPVVNVGSPGTELNQGGFEGGTVVKINGTYHMFPTERIGEQGVPSYHDRVKTRIGYWTSPDAIKWTRQHTILESSGVYALTHEDNPMNDRRSAIWSYNAIFSKEKNRWYGFYLAYTTDKDISPNHSFGRIWRCESTVEGIEGIGGPYRDMGIMIEPGLDSQLWEGRQGVASFFPFQVEGGWNAFISGAYPFQTKADYPLRGGADKEAWYVGLANSKALEGPWTRMSEQVNPLTEIYPRFVENPIVSRLPNGLYIAIFDGGPEYLKLPNKIAYTLSKDGLNWSEARYIALDAKIAKWWMVMRTPLCLIDEGNNVYTMVFTAWVHDQSSSNPHAKTRFNPIGMVKLKLDPQVLDKRAEELQ